MKKVFITTVRHYQPDTRHKLLMHLKAIWYLNCYVIARYILFLFLGSDRILRAWQNYKNAIRALVPTKCVSYNHVADIIREETFTDVIVRLLV